MSVVLPDVEEQAIAPDHGPGKQIEGRTPWQLAWAKLRRDKAAMISLAFIVLLILIAIFAPVISRHLVHIGPTDQDDGPLGLTAQGIPVGPSHKHWFGTDDVGGDVFVSLLYGARISLYVGVVAMLIQVVIGILVGIVAGYVGGPVDTFLSRFMDVILSFPFLLTALALSARFHGHGLLLTIIVLSFFGWSSVGRIVRGQVLALREREFVEAARSLGANPLRIMTVDLLPNLIAPVIVYGTLLIPINIVGESTLSFLGLGVQYPPTATWGNMLARAQAVYQSAPWFLLAPALALLFTTLAFNLLGDGLRDALDPRSERTMAK